MSGDNAETYQGFEAGFHLHVSATYAAIKVRPCTFGFPLMHFRICSPASATVASPSCTDNRSLAAHCLLHRARHVGSAQQLMHASCATALPLLCPSGAIVPVVARLTAYPAGFCMKMEPFDHSC